MKPELPITLTYRNQMSHWREYALAAQRRSFNTLRWVLSIAIGLLVGLAPAILSRCEACDVDEASLRYGILIVFVPWMLWSMFANRLMLGRMFKNESTMFHERRLTVTTEGVETDGLHDKASYEWPAIAEVGLGKTTFVFWTEPGVGFFLPRSVFNSSNEEQSFKAVVEERIAASKTT